MKRLNNQGLCSVAGIALLAGLTALMVLAPDTALAAEVDALFKSPLQKLLDLLTGTIAGLIVALCVVVAGIAYIISREDPSGWVMNLVRVAIGGVIMYGGSHIAKWWFGN